MDRSGRVKDGMEHVEVDPLSLHGACPTLLGIKASQVKSHLFIYVFLCSGSATSGSGKVPR